MYWIYNRTSTAFDGVKSDISIFPDLSKASNTEGRAMLFEKLENSVASCSALDWVKKNYFSNGFQYVQFNEWFKNHSFIEFNLNECFIFYFIFFYFSFSLLECSEISTVFSKINY